MLESLKLEIEEFDENDSEILSPYKEPYRLENWDLEDLIMYVGGDRSLYEVH